MGSYLRLNSLKIFVLFRGLRIIPALSVEVIASALILGPLVTTYALSDYFSDSRFWSYFLNITGVIQYKLPGVFTSLEDDTVNGSLWTVPSEMLCYLSLAGLAIAGFLLAPKRLAFVTLAMLTVINIAHYLWRGQWGAGFTDYKILVPCFYAGALLYLYRRYVPHSAALFVTCLTCSVLATLYSPLVVGTLGPFLVAYVINYLGLLRMPRLPIIMAGDFSYGLYLYAFPIQQLLVFLGLATTWGANFVLAWPLTFLFAAFSWYTIEKPILGLRYRLVVRR